MPPPAPSRAVLVPGASLLAALLVCAAVPAADTPRATGSATRGQVTIHRDLWGVPHVYGDSERAAAFGHGYAQAEDRLEDLLAAYLQAEGRAASVFGKAWIERDFEARIARHAEIARRRYGELDGATRGVIEGFVAGVREYMKTHPDEVPAWGQPPQPQQVLALFRAFTWVWPWRQALGDLERRGSHVDDGRGSNAWVVGPGRSAEGAVIALIDPHLAWEPTSRFYESHVHGGGLNFFGFSIIGTPFMALGHTEALSLAATTGGPDCADVYEERIHAEDPSRYLYDGQWRAIEAEEVRIAVADGGGTREEVRRVERTHHGPILRREGDRAYAVRTAYDGEVGILAQWLAMIRARNLGEFLEALSANQSLPQNLLYGDVHGQTYYVRAGRVPRRPPGRRWDRPVPGWTSDTEWRGIHPLQELVQILNPPGGYMQNCNVSPGRMMPDSPLTAERYPDYVYNTRTERSNSRGRRALALLADSTTLSVEAAMRIATDTYVDGVDAWQADLAAAFKARAERFAHLASAVQLLTSWDGRIDADSSGATLYRFCMRAARGRRSGATDAEDEAPAADDPTSMLEHLDAAVAEMQRLYGRIDVPWGQVHRARRGGQSWSVAGCSADGIKTLWSVRYSDPGPDGVSIAHGGSFATTLVVLREGAVESFSVTPYGQSNRPASAHYVDQGRRLFAHRKLKPTWFGRRALEGHVESTRTLVVPQPAKR